MFDLQREVSLLVFRADFYEDTVAHGASINRLKSVGVNKISILSVKLAGKDETTDDTENIENKRSKDTYIY